MKIYIILFSIFLLNSVALVSMKLPLDLCPKIIACCNSRTKNALGRCSTAFHSLHSKNNIDLYLQKSLVLSEMQADYALSYCAYKNNIPAVENLLQQGFRSVFMYCGIATSPLAIAKYNKNKELIKLLKRYQATDDTKYGECKFLPHALPVFFGDIEKVREYIKTEEYSPIYGDEESEYSGATLLKLAVYKGHSNVVELLLTHPKTIECINSGQNGRKAIDMAFVGMGNANILKMLLPSLELTATALNVFRCAKRGYTDCLRMFLRRGEIPINECTKNFLYDSKEGKCIFYGHIPPLTMAAYNGHIDTVALLLAHKKIKVNQPVRSGQTERIINLTALYAASLQGHTAIVKQLLACPDIKPCLYMNQYTPMHIAYKKGYIGIVRLLAKHSPQLLRMKTKDTKETPSQIANRYN